MAEDVFGIVGTVQAGSFHVERAIAEGGFGVVYRAQHGAFRAPVALKCLKIPATMNARDRDLFLEKFREEAEMIFRLSASIPEVVRPLHVDVLKLPDGRYVPFLALEWLDGEPLDQMIQKRRQSGQAPIGAPKLMKLLRPIAHALARAHRFSGPTGKISIVHRDLKPENIFICSGAAGEPVKILDFGIAKARATATQNAGRVTSEEQLSAFTPAYAAPEQWLPKRFGTTGTWTDVWGLAITMVEALSGKPPIDGDLHSMMATAVDESRRPTPRNEGVVISPEADGVFERALAVDPRDRIKDMEQFWNELQAALGLPTGLGRERRDDRADLEAVPPRDEAPPSRRSIPATSTSGSYRHVSVAPARRMSPEHAEAMTAPMHPVETAAPTSVRGTPERLSPVASLELDLPGAQAAAAPPAVRAAAAAPRMADVPDLELALPGPPSRSGVTVKPAPAPAPRSAAPPVAPRPGDDLEDDEPLAFELGSGAPAASSRPHTLAAAPAAPPSVSPRPAASGPSAGGSGLAIEIAAPAVSARPASPARPPASGRDPFSRSLEAAGMSELVPLRERLRNPIRLIGAGIAITLAELTVGRITGEALMIGPLRPSWIAIPLAVVGVALAIQRVFAKGDD